MVGSAWQAIFNCLVENRQDITRCHVLDGPPTPLGYEASLKEAFSLMTGAVSIVLGAILPDKKIDRFIKSCFVACGFLRIYSTRNVPEYNDLLASGLREGDQRISP